MTDADLAKHWNANAEAWTVLARAGGDVCRDAYNTPAFMRMLPDVSGQNGLDVGCGEGHNTRLVARRGACMTAIDLAENFIRAAKEHENREPLGIRYQQSSARRLPFADQSFDFVMSTMCFMDFPNQEDATTEVVRVLKPGGFFQFSITHPVTNTPIRYWIRDDRGRKTALATAGYFQPPNGDVEEWIFGKAPAELKRKFDRFRIPRFQRTLSSWINLVANAGLRIEQMEEPHPDAETLDRLPSEYDAVLVPYFLIMRSRKPA